MRKLALALTFSVLAIGTAHCVGDDPSTVNTNPPDDASTSDGSLGGDGSNTDGSATDSGSTDAGTDAGPIDSCIGFHDCPNQIDENTRLQIWLRGGFGETCTGGRLVSWADQSGHGNNATSPTSSDGGSGLPAQCGVRQINNQDVVTFTAPPLHDGGTTEFIDETLDTKLGFVVSSDYTFFVVHQRTSDLTQALVATDDTATFFLNCPVTNAERAYFMGFNQFSGTGFGAGYYQGCSRAIAPVDSFVLGHVDVSEVVFSAAAGHVLYENGAQVYKGDGGLFDVSAVQMAGGRGSIGRGTDTLDDDRFHGQIAEVIGFNIALSNADRLDVEGYLKRQWGLTF